LALATKTLGKLGVLRLPSHRSIGKPKRRWAGLAMRESPSMWFRSHTSR
jgi:hypothetical protein